MALTSFGTPWAELLPRLLNVTGTASLTHRDLADLMLKYYLSNGLYDEVRAALSAQGFTNERLKPLRNPTYRAVEFHVNHVWPGTVDKSFPIQTENQKIIEPLSLLWKWSNWPMNKALAVRWGVLMGDIFIRVETNETPEEKATRVRLRLVDPRDVTEVTHDPMGNVTDIRLDVPYQEIEGGEAVDMFHTEIWDEYGVRTWKMTAEDWTDNPEEMPAPETDLKFEQLGYDFVPIVHGQALDLGEGWGLPLTWPALDKVDELNRIVTALHMRLFRYNKPIHALESEGANSGQKAPPPPIFVRRSGEQADSEGTLTLGEDSMMVLPRGSRLAQLVPNLDYSGMLEVVREMGKEIEADLPELKYARLQEQGDLSGVAIRLLLSDAIGRTLAYRAAFDAALVRAHKIALTLGDLAGVFSGVGNYENGDFEHDFGDRDVIPLTGKERAEITKTRVESGIPLTIALRAEGWTEEDIAALVEAQQAEQERQSQMLAQAVMNAQDQSNQGAATAGTEE